MPISIPRTQSGKVYDPVFLLMLVAVVLAVGSSLMLRAAVSEFAPSSAHAAVHESSSHPAHRARATAEPSGREQ